MHAFNPQEHINAARQVYDSYPEEDWPLVAEQLLQLADLWEIRSSEARAGFKQQNLENLINKLGHTALLPMSQRGLLASNLELLKGIVDPPTRREPTDDSPDDPSEYMSASGPLRSKVMGPCKHPVTRLSQTNLAMIGRSGHDLIPNVDGHVVISDGVFNLFEEKVGKKVHRQAFQSGEEFVLKRAFTSIKARNEWNIKNDMNYVSSSKYLAERNGCSRVVLECRHQQIDTSADPDRDALSRKVFLCNSTILEHRYVELGIIFVYEQETSVCKHADTNPASFGLSPEIKDFLKDEVLTKCNYDIQGILDKLTYMRGKHPANSQLTDIDEQVKRFFRSIRKGRGSKQSGDEYKRHLDSRKAELQKKLKLQDQVVLKPIVFNKEGREPGLIMTCTSWLSRLKTARVVFEDATYFSHQNKSSSHVIAVKSIGSRGQIHPIAFCSAYDENIINIETFLRVLMTDVADEIGLNFPRSLEHPDRFILPRLKYFVADGIAGMNTMVERLFGPDVIRIACYFHILQALLRWLKQNDYPPKVETYVDGVMKSLSLCESHAEFFLQWADFRKQMLAKADSDPVTWKEAKAFVDHFETKLIKSDDSNRWCRAMIGDQVEYLGRCVRSTRSESFFATMKRVLGKHIGPNGITQNQAALEDVLIEHVFADLHGIFGQEKIRSIPESSWNRAWLLTELISRKHEGYRLPIAENYAYNYESGKFFALGRGRQAPTMTWGYRKSSSGVWEPKVFFDHTEESALKQKGFCIISGLLSGEGAGRRLHPDWHKKATCTCLEFLEVSGTPCVHILALALFLNYDRLPQEELFKLRLGEVEFEKMLEEQILTTMGTLIQEEEESSRPEEERVHLSQRYYPWWGVCAQHVCRASSAA